MIKRSIYKILARIYLIGKFEADKIQKREFLKNLRKESLIDESSVVTLEAHISNGTKEPSRLQIGKGCLVRGELLVFNGGGEIKVGDYCFIGQNTKIWSACKIEVGNRVLISHNVNIHDNNAHSLDPVARHEDFRYMNENEGKLKQNDFNNKPIVIEDDVWIGFNSTIMKGVTIGKASIIGAGTLVNRDIPPYSIVTGAYDLIVRPLKH